MSLGRIALPRSALVATLACAAPAVAVAATSPQAEEPTAAPQNPTPQLDDATPLDVPVIDAPQNPRRSRWYGRAALGFAYRWGFDQSMLGAALDGELGAQNHKMAGGVRLHLEAGRMLAGLAYQVVTFGPMMWLFTSTRARVGAGIDAGALLISRRTIPGRAMWTVMLGGHLAGSVDLLKVGASGALQLDATVGVYALTLAPGPISISTTVGLGYRP